MKKLIIKSTFGIIFFFVIFTGLSGKAHASFNATTVTTGTLNSGTSSPSAMTSFRNNNNVMYLLANNGTGLHLYCTTNPDATSPSYSDMGTLSSINGVRGAMYWYGANSEAEITYGRTSLENNNNMDIFYRRLSAAGGSTCNGSIGAEQTVFNGSSGGSTYSDPLIIVKGLSSTDTIYIFAMKGSSGGNPTAVVNATAATGSDAPTFTALDPFKSGLTGSAGTSMFGVTTYTPVAGNAGMILFYYTGTNMVASRHDDSLSNTQANWKTMDDVTGSSQTTISADDPKIRGMGSVTTSGSYVWFAWTDASNNINTQSWLNGTGLGTEETPVATTNNGAGPLLELDPNSTDGSTGYVYLIYQKVSDNTIMVYQRRPYRSTASTWNGVETTIEDSTENLAYPAGGQNNQSTSVVDLIYTTQTNSTIRHADMYTSYTASGNVFDTDETTHIGSPTCDDVTTNITIRINGDYESNITCASTDSSFVGTVIASSSADAITIYLTGTNKANTVASGGQSATTIGRMNLFKNRLNVVDSGGGGITNAMVGVWDNDNDAPNMLFTSNSNNLVVESNIGLSNDGGPNITGGVGNYNPGGHCHNSGNRDLSFNSNRKRNGVKYVYIGHGRKQFRSRDHS